jgi:methyl-accepting chemotaxis protein-1 (serine sensor receptor)
VGFFRVGVGVDLLPRGDAGAGVAGVAGVGKLANVAHVKPVSAVRVGAKAEPVRVPAKGLASPVATVGGDDGWDKF